LYSSENKKYLIVFFILFVHGTFDRDYALRPGSVHIEMATLITATYYLARPDSLFFLITQ